MDDISIVYEFSLIVVCLCIGYKKKNEAGTRNLKPIVELKNLNDSVR